jgi:hypothetical protein
MHVEMRYYPWFLFSALASEVMSVVQTVACDSHDPFNDGGGDCDRVQPRISGLLAVADHLCHWLPRARAVQLVRRRLLCRGPPRVCMQRNSGFCSAHRTSAPPQMAHVAAARPSISALPHRQTPAHRSHAAVKKFDLAAGVDLSTISYLDHGHAAVRVCTCKTQARFTHFMNCTFLLCLSEDEEQPAAVASIASLEARGRHGCHNTLRGLTPRALRGAICACHRVVYRVIHDRCDLHMWFKH